MKVKKLLITVLLSVLCLVFLLVCHFISFQQNVDEINKKWSLIDVNKITNFASTKTLSILPLVNWHTESDRLKGEAGVSYLIKTDNQTVLFDVGFNAKNEEPSPLEHNMKALEVDVADIDSIFLSHHHLDHSGGQRWVNQNTISLGIKQVDLTGKKIYSPVKINYPQTEVVLTAKPNVIGEGIASIGGISRQLFMGRIKEQALAINVEGKGIVVIVGCGHQTLTKILHRTKQLFSQPLYGLVGDLHYPVPEGRLSFLGINLQRVFASGDGPHQTIHWQDIHNELALLSSENPSLVALGGHDTSDEVIESFKQTFGDSYRYVRVGEWITIKE